MTRKQMEDLGLSIADIQDRIIDKAVEQLLGANAAFDEDGEPTRNTMEAQISKRIESAVTTKVEAMCKKILEPIVQDRLAGWVFKPTNRWGEPKEEPTTLAEFIAKRCQEYLSEPVNYEGKAKGEDRYSSSWSAKTSRVGWMIDKHITFHVENAFKPVIKSAHELILKAINDDITKAMHAAADKLKVAISVETMR